MYCCTYYCLILFKVRWHSSHLTYNSTHSCHDVVVRSLASSAANSSVADAFFGILHGVDDNNNNSSGSFSEVIDVVIEDNNSEDHYDWLDSAMLQSCVKRMTSMHYDNASLAQVVVRHTRKYIELTPTSLRRSPTYYFYYCVLASCMVSMILPLAALLFLNISTARVLNKMVKDEEEEFFAQVDSNGGGKRPSSHGFKYHLRRLTTATLVTSNVEDDAEDPELDHSSSAMSDQNKNADTLVLNQLNEGREGGELGHQEAHQCETNNVQLAGEGGGGDGSSVDGITGETGKEFNLGEETKFEDKKGKKKVQSSSRVLENPNTKLSETPAVTLTAATSNGRLSPLVLPTPTEASLSPKNAPAPSRASLSPCDAEREAFLASRIARNTSQNGKVGTFSATRLNSCASPSLRAPSPCARVSGGVDGASKAHRRRERRLARISISIVWLFVVCHVWKLIPTAYEALHSDDGLNVDSWPFWLIIIEHVSHTLITFNSAVNFLIYVLK